MDEDNHSTEYDDNDVLSWLSTPSSKQPATWARIGVMGSHRSGKELFVASIANGNPKQPPPPHGSLLSSNSFSDPVPTATPPADLQSSASATTPPRAMSLDSPVHAAATDDATSTTRTAELQAEDPNNELLSLLQDAARTLVECGGQASSHPFPTRATVRIAAPAPATTSAHQPSSPPSVTLLDSNPVAPPRSDATGAAAVPSPSSGGGAMMRDIHIEVVNYWTFIVPGGEDMDLETPHDVVVSDGVGVREDVTSPPSSSLPPPRALIPDVALVTCDAFLIVLDVTRYDTLRYADVLLSTLHSIHTTVLDGAGDLLAEGSATLGPTSAQPPATGLKRSPAGTSRRRPVVAAIASTHRVPPPPQQEGSKQVNTSSTPDARRDQRSITSDDCRALGTRWSIPVFELSLEASSNHRHRKVLEKIISRVLHDQRSPS